MNLWRRSKSWFQDGFSTPKQEFNPQHYLHQEKELLAKKYEREKMMLEKRFHEQMAEAKMRFDSEWRRLVEEHERLKAKSNNTVAGEESEKLSVDVLSLMKKNQIRENDGLEWDPSDDMKSYNEDDMSDSWDFQSDEFFRPNSSVFNREQFDDVESCDSAYSSLSTELKNKIFPEEGSGLVTRYQHSVVESKVEQLRLSLRREVIKECEEKFTQERNFLYSVIEELEENVLLLRKQKEDIVAIFETEREKTSKGDEKESKPG